MYCNEDDGQKIAITISGKRKNSIYLSKYLLTFAETIECSHCVNIRVATNSVAEYLKIRPNYSAYLTHVRNLARKLPSINFGYSK